MKAKDLLLTLSFIVPYFYVHTQTFTFDFGIDDQMFEGGVADFGVNMSNQHEFTFENRPYQLPLDTTRLAQFISGINPSDDLFMYMKRNITGLLPNTTYHTTFVVEFASPYPTNAFGVGGPPGEGVTMKAGLTLIEPDTMIVNMSGPFVVMNIDKGNQSSPGPDMDTIGHVGVNDTTTVWAMKTNDNLNHPFTFTTDASGSAWFILGTDSGFESKTELFISKITVDFTIVTSVEVGLKADNISVYPNPSSGSIHISSNAGDFNMIQVYDNSGRLFRSYQMKSSEATFNLPRSNYLIKIITGNSTVVKRVVVQ
ncbi:MAG TPA: T9SS type A sorting domain-containing protein [Saprospiraceae bacterium]|nr:T9SS type A sorting domain-containing protein [Saprospiraceae bacterium]